MKGTVERGTGRTMTAASAVFLASDVGRAILWNAGVAVITGFTDTQTVTVEVKVIFDSTSIPSGAWNLDASPQTTLTPGAKDPVGTSTSLTLLVLPLLYHLTHGRRHRATATAAD